MKSGYILSHLPTGKAGAKTQRLLFESSFVDYPKIHAFQTAKGKEF